MKETSVMKKKDICLKGKKRFGQKAKDFRMSQKLALVVGLLVGTNVKGYCNKKMPYKYCNLIIKGFGMTYLSYIS